MKQATGTGLRLELSDGRETATTLADVNRYLAPIASRVWPLDVHGGPADIQRLLLKSALTDEEADRVKAHFLLPRDRLIEIITGAGRTPNAPGGGDLTTFDVSHGYSYPQLWIVQGGMDYSRFDRFHVNVSEDGTAVDEVAQLLSGAGVVIRHRLPDGAELTLQLDCPEAGAGWLLTYDGGAPHIGSVSGAEPGTKLLVQVIGPPRWRMQYQTDASGGQEIPDR